MNEKELAEFIHKNQLVSIMNDTKWRELILSITADDNFDPSVNIKYLDDNENNNLFSTVWWEEVESYGYKAIEWIKINPIKETYQGRLIENKKEDFSSLIQSALDKYNIPYELEEGVFCINGYLKTRK
jgi:hypothetical protein